LTYYSRPLRKLNDEELDSGDDEDRNDRLMDDADGDVDMELEGQSANIMDIKLGRHAVPDPSDGEVC
jgi:RNA polymerase-associated protein LEO1